MAILKILFVLTSSTKLGNTENPSGFWLSELAIPYYAAIDRGAKATLASIKGGKGPIDPESKKDQWQTDETRRFLADKAAMGALSKTAPIAALAADDYDAVYIPGGLGTMWDFPVSLTLKSLLEGFLAARKPIATLCHGASALLNVTTPEGKPIVAGKTVTCFSNAEEAQIGMTGIVPFLLQSRLGELGAKVKPGKNWSPTVHREGLLLTGQNPASALPLAEALFAVLGEKRRKLAA